MRSLAGLGHFLEDGVLLVGLGCEGSVLAGEGDLEVFDVTCVYLQKGVLLVLAYAEGWKKGKEGENV